MDAGLLAHRSSWQQRHALPLGRCSSACAPNSRLAADLVPSLSSAFFLGKGNNFATPNNKKSPSGEKKNVLRLSVTFAGDVRDQDDLALDACVPTRHLRASSALCSRRAISKQAQNNSDFHLSPLYFVLPSATPTKMHARNDTDTDGFFIPPARDVNERKLVVVLDLDETLVYSRAGPIIPRPGVDRLLNVLRGRCEVVVWTAGEKLYAMDVLRRIDPHLCVQHCVYRHEKWWTDKPGCVKDLSALGRPLQRTLIIDNTPDCLRVNPQNGILVKDFRGGHGDHSKFDDTLFIIADVIDDVLRGPVVSVDAFHKHPKLKSRRVRCENGGVIRVLTLKQDHFDIIETPRSFGATRRPLLRTKRCW